MRNQGACILRIFGPEQGPHNLALLRFRYPERVLEHKFNNHYSSAFILFILLCLFIQTFKQFALKHLINSREEIQISPVFNTQYNCFHFPYDGKNCTQLKTNLSKCFINDVESFKHVSVIQWIRVSLGLINRFNMLTFVLRVLTLL